MENGRDQPKKSGNENGNNNGNGVTKRVGRDDKGWFLPGNSYEFKPGDPRINREGRRRAFYGVISQQIDSMPCSEAPWASRLATKLGFKPEDITIGEMLVHADKWNRVRGRVGYLVEDNARREGKVPDTIAVEIPNKEAVRTTCQRLGVPFTIERFEQMFGNESPESGGDDEP